MNSSEANDSRFAEILAECERLREENRELKERLGLPACETPPQIATPERGTPNPVTINAKSTPDKKVALFRNLFRGREDVYALRWEGRNGTAGYSPAYRKIWSSPLQKKPDEPKEYFPLTDQVIHDHLTAS